MIQKTECRANSYPYFYASGTGHTIEEIISPFSFLSSDMYKYRSFSPSHVKDVQFFPPATKMYFTDGTVITSVAQEGDEFDPITGMMMCIFEYIFKNKTYNNFFRRWIKKDKAEKDQKIREAAKNLEKEEAREKRIKKKAAKRLIKQMAKKEEEIEIRKEAYLRAMREFSEGGKECPNIE